MTRIALTLAFALALVACGHHDEEEPGLSDAVPASAVTAPGGGSKTAGAKCDAQTGCAAGLSCVTTQPGATSGVCVAVCSVLNDECANSPGSSVGLCATKVGSALHCGYLCRVLHEGHADSFPCPPELTCPSTDAVPGARLCVPK
jgi:hypothetical protein